MLKRVGFVALALVVIAAVVIVVAASNGAFAEQNCQTQIIQYPWNGLYRGQPYTYGCNEYDKRPVPPRWALDGKNVPGRLVVGEIEVTVNGQPTLTCNVGEKCAFSLPIMSGAEMLYKVTWDFGDTVASTNAEGVLYTHLYKSIGDKTVTATITDLDGKTITAQTRIRVLDPKGLLPPPVVATPAK